VAAKKNKIAPPVATSEIITSFISLAPVFLPGYSGVLPSMRPAMKMVIRRVGIIETMHEPVPPKITSPFLRLKSWIRPASGVKLSCMLLTAPSLDAV